MTVLDPLIPRPIDLPTPIDGELDRAKIVAAPDDPADWPDWRDRLRDGLSWIYPGPQMFVYE